MSNREPTIHEQRAGQPWDASYRDGPAPWDIGRAQPAVERLVSDGVFTGRVLDAGCGAGDNALRIAATGVSVLGIDVAETAVAMAREKADALGADAEFEVADALQLPRLGRTFDTVLDSALFHALEGDERHTYAAGLAAVMDPGARLHLLCFSDADPDRAGPHPVSEDEIRAVFAAGAGWSVETLAADTLATRFHPDGAAAWLAAIATV